MHSSVLLARITVTHLRDSCTTDNKPQVANSPMNEEATPMWLKGMATGAILLFVV